MGVAAVNGAWAGIGLNQALMCDARFAAPGAKFAAAFSARGLVAKDGVSWTLPRLVGYGHASDLLLSSRRLLPTPPCLRGPVDGAREPPGRSGSPAGRSGRVRHRTRALRARTRCP
ncbi:enoyl-CoA hydratase-related protein [Streptomyces sp. NPDC005803]|uniref:enoyl-CoA hydratase-related protein n=1 Tax=Streptomyces sp. NPDC005803 TaxID=3154297 RepID=UPI0033DB149E